MTVTVWGAGTGRTIRVHWALAELGVDYETKPIGPRTGETQSPEFRGLSIKEKIPVLVDGDLVLTESAAIVTYLGDKHGGLTPAVGTTDRARYGEWLSFILMELDAHTLYVMRKHGDLAYLYGEAPAAMAAARAGFEKQLRWALPRFGAAEYLVGTAFTGVDILMTSCLDWAVNYGFDLPATADAYRERHHQRPAFAVAKAANSPSG